MVSIPRVVIAAPGSGHGKTSVATGLLGALRERGLTVSPHKVGPDYIDPGYHALAAGRPGRNLDPWLVGEDQVAPMFAHGASTPVPADIAVIEGVMGLFDGASLASIRDGGGFASTAHVARLLDAPIVLVVDAGGMAASAAALLHGFATFDPRTRIGGVIFNMVGSPGHEELLRDAAGAAGLPVLGVIGRREQLTVPSRHLGLIPAAELGAPATEAVAALAAIVAAGVDLDAVVRLARTAGPLPDVASAASPAQPPHNRTAEREPRIAFRPRIAVAAGPAFTFGYAEHPELLAAAGAEVVPFDPLRDEGLPDDTDGLIIGGGFPEAHAAELSANARLRAQVAALARAGAPVVAECAGLLYLARSLDQYPMCGVLDAEAAMTSRLTLGYRDAVAAVSSPLAAAGQRVHGHEFHRTALTLPDGPTPGGAVPDGAAGDVGGPAAAAWHWRHRGTAVTEGFVRGRVHASYLHTHWNGVPGAADRLVAAARAYRLEQAAP
jgi:cobyrinic acid a,c-diamide synthase